MNAGEYIALVGVAVAVYYGFRTLRTGTKSRYNEAASKFREAFRSEIVALDAATSICHDPHEMLEAAFNKHRAALDEFLPVLHKVSRFDAEGLENAWNEYYRPEGAPGVHMNALVQYAGIPFCGESEARRRRDLARRRLERLVSYAPTR